MCPQPLSEVPHLLAGDLLAPPDPGPSPLLPRCQLVAPVHPLREICGYFSHDAYFPNGRPPNAALPNLVPRKYAAAFLAFWLMSHMLKDDVESYN